MAGFDPLTTPLSDIWAGLAPFLKLYTQYGQNYGPAIDVFQKVQSNPQMRAFCQAAQTDERCRNLDLGSYLIKPIQRIPRYTLLLREVLKVSTMPCHAMPYHTIPYYTIPYHIL
jgi:hypothetical protein